MKNVELLRQALSSLQEGMQMLQAAGGSGSRPPFDVPAGSVGIKLPPGSVVDVVNGSMVVKDQNGNVLPGPFESYDVNSKGQGGYSDFMGASANGSTGIIVGPDGTIVGVAEGGAAVGVGASINGGYGPLTAAASAFAGAAASGMAGFKFDPSNLTLVAAAKGEAMVGVEVKANAEVSLGELGKAYAEGQAFAGARASAGGEINIDPLNGTMYANGSFDMFAGAQAGIDGGIDTPVGGVKGGADVYAGVGVSGHVDASIEDGEVTLGVGFGAALGIGAAFDFEVSVDFGGIADGIGDAADSVGDAVGDVVGGIGDALSSF